MAFTWTDDPLIAGTIYRDKIHFVELHEALWQIYTDAGLTSDDFDTWKVAVFSEFYTDAAYFKPYTRNDWIEEIRTALENESLITICGYSDKADMLNDILGQSDWTDSILVAGKTFIRNDHIEELRQVMDNLEIIGAIETWETVTIPITYSESTGYGDDGSYGDFKTYDVIEGSLGDWYVRGISASLPKSLDINPVGGRLTNYYYHPSGRFWADVLVDSSKAINLSAKNIGNVWEDNGTEYMSYPDVKHGVRTNFSAMDITNYNNIGLDIDFNTFQNFKLNRPIGTYEGITVLYVIFRFKCLVGVSYTYRNKTILFTNRPDDFSHLTPPDYFVTSPVDADLRIPIADLSLPGTEKSLVRIDMQWTLGSYFASGTLTGYSHLQDGEIDVALDNLGLYT